MLRRLGLQSTKSLLAASRKPISPALFARNYALSRNPSDTSRIHRPRPPAISRRQSPANETITPSSPELIQQNELLMQANPDSGGLEALLANDTLVVVRQIEMLNLFMGFEVGNRYALNDEQGNVLGYIAEEERGFLGTFSRQIFRTHRAFRSVIMDKNGTPVLWIHRPFSFINSRLFVQRKLAEDAPSPEGENLSLMTFGEARQEWHPWRRKYHLFLGQPDTGAYHQFAQIDSGLLAWEFFLQNENDRNTGSICKGWTGVGREIFTDTSQYTIRFTPDPGAPGTPVVQTELGAVATPFPVKPLSLEERALVLALSVGIDFDYFSRHSEGGGGGWFLPLAWIFSAAE